RHAGRPDRLRHRRRADRPRHREREPAKTCDPGGCGRAARRGRPERREASRHSRRLSGTVYLDRSTAEGARTERDRHGVPTEGRVRAGAASYRDRATRAGRGPRAGGARAPRSPRVRAFRADPGPWRAPLTFNHGTNYGSRNTGITVPPTVDGFT